MRKFLTAAVVLMWAAVLLGGAFRPQQAASDTTAPHAGSAAPPLALADLEGKPISLESFRGKAVMLNFWASWCPPCRLEMPDIQRLAGNLPEGTALLTVNTESDLAPAEVRAFLEQQGYTFPVAHDASGIAYESYRVISLPTTLFIGPDGVVVHRINGPLAYGAMLDYLNAARR